MRVEMDAKGRCGSCGREIPLLFVDCLSRGWPECCDATMTVIAWPQRRAESSEQTDAAPRREAAGADTRERL